MATPKARVKQQKEMKLLQKIYDEVRQIREELFWLTRPEEDLEGYTHPEEILKAREEALKQYPPKI